YCDVNAETGFELGNRRGYRTVLDIIFHALVRWSAPVLVFTAEEVWETRYPDGGSVHLLEWPEVPAIQPIGEGWFSVRSLREQVSNAIEPMRRDKIVGSSLEVELDVEVYDQDLFEYLTERNLDLAELCIVSSLLLRNAPMPRAPDEWCAAKPYRVLRRVGDVAGLGLSPSKSSNLKCGRCWRHLPEVEEDGGLCGRCAEVVGH
ncbi:MAG: class I tRNA ligase family protein, partial [Sphingomonas sp.]|nr:class I tRNA ligase family protein [Sphingomonas sp.]